MQKCKVCGALQVDNKWYAPGTYDKKVDDKALEPTICPGDEMLQKGDIKGVVRLSGSFIDDHEEEILNLVRNVAREKLERNISARMFDFEPVKGSSINIETTDTHLAVALGKEVEKAFKGELTIDWLEGASSVRVDWVR